MVARATQKPPAPFALTHSLQQGLNLARRRALSRRVAARTTTAAQGVPMLRFWPRCFTRAAGMLHGLYPTQTSPCSGRTASSGDAPPRELQLRRSAPPTVRPISLDRTIRRGRTRLDRVPVRSNPPDLDPTDQIRRYRFGPPLLLKNPPGSEYSTRGPALVKNNYGLVLFFSKQPPELFKF